MVVTELSPTLTLNINRSCNVLFLSLLSLFWHSSFKQCFFFFPPKKCKFQFPFFSCHLPSKKRYIRKIKIISLIFIFFLSIISTRDGKSNFSTSPRHHPENQLFTFLVHQIFVIFYEVDSSRLPVRSSTINQP